MTYFQIYKNNLDECLLLNHHVSAQWYQNIYLEQSRQLYTYKFPNQRQPNKIREVSSDNEYHLQCFHNAQIYRRYMLLVTSPSEPYPLPGLKFKNAYPGAILQRSSLNHRKGFNIEVWVDGEYLEVNFLSSSQHSVFQ